MRLSHIVKQLAALSLLTLAACKTPNAVDTEVKSGPGGKPEQWTCATLKSEFGKTRADLVSSLETYNATKARLNQRAQADDKKDINNNDDSQLGLAGDKVDVQTSLGTGDDTLPEWPAEMKKFPEQFFGLASGRALSGCDDIYGKYGQDSANPILEQCRYTVKLFNTALHIQSEYNQGRDGECRSGKANFQTQQSTSIFPYCKNPCRFGSTACAKCEFTVGALTSHYICGDEQDARQAVKEHCKSLTSLCTTAEATRCVNEVFNDIAAGTTSLKESDTKVSVSVNVNEKFNIEWKAAAEVKVHRETKIEVSLEAHLQMKNSKGSPIFQVNGGETASTYSCSVQVGAAVIKDTGIDVGAGFDIVVAKGSQTVGAGINLEAATTYKSQSPDIPAGGATLVNMLEGCKRFALAWGTKELPSLLTQNIAFKAVASRFMGDKKDMFQQRISGTNTYCKTDRRTSYLTSSPVQYKITKVWWDLSENAIGFKYQYEGSYLGYDSPVFSFTAEHLGQERYAKLRKAVFDGSVAIDDIRALITTAYDHNGWVKECQEGKF